MRRLFFSSLMCALPALGHAAGAIATVTILEGDPALVVRDASKVAAIEGVKLQADDIVEAGAKTRLMRIEFTDGTLLDVGPSTQMILSPRLAGDRAKRPMKIYLMQGYVKLTAPKAPGTANVTSATLDATDLARDMVLSVQPLEIRAFAESGEVTLTPRAAGKPTTSVKLKNGEFYARGADGKGVVSSRPSPAFVQTLPKAFLDTLPARADMFKTRVVEPKALGTIAYTDVQAWIDAEPALRSGFVTRWKAQARNPEFRKGLVAGIAAHPEWDRTLFPEKYLPKPALHPASGRY